MRQPQVRAQQEDVRQTRSPSANWTDRTDQLHVGWGPEPASTNRPWRSSSNKAQRKEHKGCQTGTPSSGAPPGSAAHHGWRGKEPRRCSRRSIGEATWNRALDLSSSRFLARRGGATIRPKLRREHHIAHPGQRSGTPPVTPKARAPTHKTAPTNRAPTKDQGFTRARSPTPHTSLPFPSRPF